MLLLLAVPIGLLLGLLSGGSISCLRTLRLRGELLLVILLPVVLILQTMAIDSSRVLLVIRFAVALVVLMIGLWNWGQYSGLAVATIGLTLNALVVLMYGRMPVLYRAAVALPDDYYHRAVGEVGGLVLLAADVVPVPWGTRTIGIVSIGDILLLVGVGALITQALTRGGEDRGMV